MEYVMLIFESPADFEARTEERGEPFRGAWRAYFQAMVDAGVYVDGRPLHAGARGTTIRVRGGKRGHEGAARRLHRLRAPLARRGARLGGAMSPGRERDGGGPAGRRRYPRGDDRIEGRDGEDSGYKGRKAT